MKPRANARQQRRADIPAFWCSWGRHDTIQMSHVKEQFPTGTMCLACQMKIVENITEVISFPQMSLAMHRQEQRLLEARRRNNKFEKRMKILNPFATGIVYYMRINGQIKIGYTTNLTQRSRNYPPGTELLAVEPAGPYTERDRHQQFHRSRVRGREWFDETPDLAEHIADLAAAHGVPTELMHQYTTPKGT